MSFPGVLRRQLGCFARGVLVLGSVSLTAAVLSPADAVSTTRDAGSVAGADNLFRDRFEPNIRLVTNEYAYRNIAQPGVWTSPDWQVTSGSLFVRDGAGWTGIPDGNAPDPESSTATGSAVFRLNTVREDFGNVRVDLALNVRSLTTTSRTPAVDWDGVHIWLRHQSQYRLYSISVARRDGSVVIKKKCPGGPSNGGTYYELTDFQPGHAIPFGAWRHVTASARDNADGSVTLTGHIDGVEVLSAVDTGVGCDPIVGPAPVGVRGDNADFRFDDFTVTGLSGAASTDPGAGPAVSLEALPGDGRVHLSWLNPLDRDLTSVEVRYAAGSQPPSTVSEGEALILDAPMASEVSATGLRNGEQYAFSVFTRNGSGEVGPPASITATPTQSGVEGLGASSGDGAVRLSWINPEGTEEIVLRYSTEGSPQSPTEGVGVPLTDTPTRAEIVGLANGRTYHFSVFAARGGEFAAPARVSAVPSECPDLAPALATAALVSSGGWVSCASPAAHDGDNTLDTTLNRTGPRQALMTTGRAARPTSPRGFDGSGAGPATGYRGAFDVSVYEMTLEVPPGAACLALDMAFASEEHPGYLEGFYDDAFLAQLDADDWSVDSSGGTAVIDAVGNFAADATGNPISVNSDVFAPTATVPPGSQNGTEYDAMTPQLTVSTPIASGQHRLYLSIFDVGDDRYDTGVFLDNLRTLSGACSSGPTVPSVPTEMTITSSARSLQWPDEVTVAGKASWTTGTFAGQVVELWAKTGASAFAKEGETPTSGIGEVELTHRPQAQTRYEWRVPESTVVSPRRTVKVRPLVAARASNPTVSVNGSVTVSGRVSPARAGTPVLLQRLTAGAWKQVASTTTTTSSSATNVGDGAPYQFPVTDKTSGTHSYRVRLPADAGRLVATSRTVKVGSYAVSTPGHQASGDEFLTIRNSGKVAVNLDGWTITTSSGKRLALPSKTMAPGARVKMHPGSGTTKGRNVYLRQGASFGNVHDTLTLLDRSGVKVAVRGY